MIAIATLKSWLGNPDEPGVTALLTTLETVAVEFVEDETGRYFGLSTTKTEYLEGDGTSDLWLNENATAITSVGQRRLVGDTFETITEGNSDGFEIRAPQAESGRARLIRKGSVGWLDRFEYKVIYEFGYASGSEPERIRQAVMDLVAIKYNARGYEGLKTFAAGGVARTQIDPSDILQVHGLARTLKMWRIRKMVLQ